MKNIALNIDKTAGFIAEGAVKAYAPKVQEALEMLEKGTGLGNDFLGWLHLPSSITEEHLNDIQATADTLRELCDVVVVAGIGDHVQVWDEKAWDAKEEEIDLAEMEDLFTELGL